MKYIKKRDSYRLTNYTKRHKLLKSKKLILKIRKSNRQIYLKVCKYSDRGDIIQWSTNTKKIGHSGKNCTASTALGHYFAQNIKYRDLILDTGQVGGFPDFVKSFINAVNSKISATQQQIIRANRGI